MKIAALGFLWLEQLHQTLTDSRVATAIVDSVFELTPVLCAETRDRTSSAIDRRVRL